MITAEEFLKHVYDPVKAREYYLRTRELKGRTPGKQDKPVNKSPVSPTVTTGRKQGTALTLQKPKTPGKSLTTAERKAVVEKRVAALKGRLEKLKTVLAELVEQAKIRSGVDPADANKDDKKSPSDAKSDKDRRSQTAAEKKAARERYEKTKRTNSTPEGQEAKLRSDIEAIEKKIAKAREELRDAVVRARNKAAVVKSAPQRRVTLRKDSQNGS